MKAFSLTEGRVAPTLVRFALPFMLSSLLQSLYGAADLFVWVNTPVRRRFPAYPSALRS